MTEQELGTEASLASLGPCVEAPARAAPWKQAGREAELLKLPGDGREERLLGIGRAGRGLDGGPALEQDPDRVVLVPEPAEHTRGHLMVGSGAALPLVSLPHR